MLVTVVGKLKKPYSIDGKSGISYKLSVCAGDYYDDPLIGQEGVGQQYFEVKCPEKYALLLSVGDEIYVDLDDKKERVKDMMIRNSDGSFSPIR